MQMAQYLFICLVIVLFPVDNFVQGNENVTADHSKDEMNGRLEVPSIEQCKHYVLFTAAAYCSIKSLQSWNCQHCNATGENVSMYKVLTNSTHGTFGYVAIDKMKKEIIVTFRGSYNVKNHINNLMVAQESLDGEIKVHSGFLTAANSLYGQVVLSIKELLEINPGVTSIVIVGHSLGAAIASITIYKLQTNQEFVNLTYSLYTYGQPRTGNKAYADYLNNLSIVAARVTSNKDIVPHVPPALLGYVHHQNEIFINGTDNKICSNRIYEDPDCSDAVSPQEYSVVDHWIYLDVNYGICLLEDPMYFLSQMIQ